MAKNPDPRITPYLLYEDVGAALQWLSSAFGLKPYGDVYKDDGGVINHAAMKLGDGVIMMGHPGPDYRNPHKLGGVTQNLYVRVKGVDEHFARARSGREDPPRADRYVLRPPPLRRRRPGRPRLVLRPAREIEEEEIEEGKIEEGKEERQALTANAQRPSRETAQRPRHETAPQHARRARLHRIR